MNLNNDFWLIDSNFVGVMRFYKNKDHSDKSIAYMFIEEGSIMGIHGENPPLMKTRKKIVIEEGSIMGIHGENPPLMKTRKKIVIEEARLLWQKLLKEGWQQTKKKW
ncbi:putative TIR domain [Prochlorococcus marinus str. MIT 9201]|uniref:Putative TIR domain n=1 Tax=Prochlorococcus marinus str. MIT 9201 TaxID=93057 RepID=A0A0A2A774_PROMR|nr:DUF1651 domain-containing protein [Prochlorococcus marinus]KGF96354.1 putative TIR domain [Prochlorococcus marinus str. MIT 9201]